MDVPGAGPRRVGDGARAEQLTAMTGCSECLCRACLLWWSERCPFGGCWDDHRALVSPFPGPERRTWTNWDKPGEQAHWCRGGFFYPADACPEFRPYEPPVVQVCLLESVLKWPDGYIQCGLVETQGCRKCWERTFGKEETE